MLKRHRTESLGSFYDATEDEKSLPEDLSEPMSKRRRYFTPEKFDTIRGQSPPSYNDENEDETQAGSSQPNYRRAGVQEWQQHAGQYKEANSRLHDLHAEQRHRMLFATDKLAGHALSAPFPPNVEDSDYVTDVSYLESANVGYASDGRISNQAEADVVARRYEETNKLLGSLFLSRRKAAEHSVGPS